MNIERMKAMNKHLVQQVAESPRREIPWTRNLIYTNKKESSNELSFLLLVKIFNLIFVGKLMFQIH
jgi:hypothetical protein